VYVPEAALVSAGLGIEAIGAEAPSDDDGGGPLSLMDESMDVRWAGNSGVDSGIEVLLAALLGADR
jgi:hypothetical protein